MKTLPGLLFRGCLIIAASFAISPLLTSCGNELKADDASELNAGSVDRTTRFLIDAAEINLEEIELGKLAQTNSFMDPVQEMGKMMQVEHTESMRDLKSLAATKDIDIPTAISVNGEAARKSLSEKSGVDFDKDYCNHMVKGHKQAISIFEKASIEITDPEIQSWARSMIPVLQVQLDHAIACEKACEKNM